ncbi:hypothetical protein KC352_g3 [Hortaea werneckii]|nr:hypothetical protein KC352_g3 [Hortaea werneckii]
MRRNGFADRQAELKPVEPASERSIYRRSLFFARKMTFHPNHYGCFHHPLHHARKELLMMKLDALCSNVARDEMKTAMAAYRTGAAESAQMFKRGIARVTPLKINGTICCYRHIASEGSRQLVSHPYNAPLPKTNAEPIIILPLSSCPNRMVLRMKDTSFLIFSTIVTVTAEDLADSRFTPEMHASCVNALIIRKTDSRSGAACWKTAHLDVIAGEASSSICRIVAVGCWTRA